MNRLFGVLRIPSRPKFCKQRYSEAAAEKLRSLLLYESHVDEALTHMFLEELNDGGLMAFYLHNEWDFTEVSFDVICKLQAARNLPRDLFMLDLCQWKVVNNVSSFLDPCRPIMYWDKLVTLLHTNYKEYLYTFRYVDKRHGEGTFDVRWEDPNVIQT